MATVVSDGWSTHTSTSQFERDAKNEKLSGVLGKLSMKSLLPFLNEKEPRAPAYRARARLPLRRRRRRRNAGMEE